MSIHVTAIIHPEADIGADVEIGPHVCIEGPAIIGAGCRIEAHAVITGVVRMGKNNIVGHGAIIGAEPQDLGFQPGTPSEVVIGDSNRIRELCTIHRGAGEGTRVGDHNYLMAGAHLAHNVAIGSHIVIANNALLGGHVRVEDRVFIGGGCVFHQFVRVGRLALTQGLSAFSKDIPPFTIAAERNTVAGLNVVGLRRAGLGVEQRQEIKDAFKLLYKTGLNTSQALERAGRHRWGPAGEAFFAFVAAAKKRGICDLLETSR